MDIPKLPHNKQQLSKINSKQAIYCKDENAYDPFKSNSIVDSTLESGIGTPDFLIKAMGSQDWNHMIFNQAMYADPPKPRPKEAHINP
jgi:hypothetical protein